LFVKARTLASDVLGKTAAAGGKRKKPPYGIEIGIGVRDPRIRPKVARAVAFALSRYENVGLLPT
jgi:hypothetical protein